jgi:predicted O-methyltransferase YrrM
MLTFKINYNSNKTELCELGKKYDTDKSSQRSNVTNTRHCHPYTLFYDAFFKNKKNEKLEIAELGILDGASLLMWREYFTNSNIYGFEYNNNLINNFKQNFNNERINLFNINVTSEQNIKQAFGDVNKMYDIIIEDTTHQFEDQIRVIKNTYQYLKPGGVMVIEDIFKSYNEKNYIDQLKDILHHFEEYFFVELDHVNRNSTGWDNDKLFVLIKKGEREFTNKITIITPSYRLGNLPALKNSINFDYVDEWIIVYDGTKIEPNTKLFENEPKIKEYTYKGDGISGNPQRNYGLSKISNEDTLLYYLDDDNIVHPDLYKMLNIIDKNKMYTFNQTNGLCGNNIILDAIDTAMFICGYKLCKNLGWVADRYNADGIYITQCYEQNKKNHVFIDNDLCYYNKINLN